MTMFSDKALRHAPNSLLIRRKPFGMPVVAGRGLARVVSEFYRLFHSLTLLRFISLRVMHVQVGFSHVVLLAWV